MRDLKCGQLYNVTKLHEGSAFYSVRSQIEGCVVVLAGTNYDVGSRGHHSSVRNAKVRFITGSLRGKVIVLSWFQAKQVPRDVCTCGAYKFPHTQGNGKCVATGDDLFCGDCKLPCNASSVDNGIGETEFWGVKGWHHDYCYQSDCCEAEVYTDSELQCQAEEPEPEPEPEEDDLRGYDEP